MTGQGGGEKLLNQDQDREQSGDSVYCLIIQLNILSSNHEQAHIFGEKQKIINVEKCYATACGIASKRNENLKICQVIFGTISSNKYNHGSDRGRHFSTFEDD